MGLPIYEYNSRNAKQFNGDTPSIGFLPFLSVPHTSLSNHTSLLVFGMVTDPLLIDGANDQTDQSTPFLITQINGQNHNATCASLKRFNRRIKDLDSREKGGDGIKSVLPSVLASCKKIGVFTDDDIKLMLLQFNKENTIGLPALFFLNRDWLAYFTKALGVDYPSIQKSIQKLHLVMRGNNIPIPKINNPKEDMLNNLAARLKGEGLI